MQELMCSSNNRSLDLSLAYYQASTGEPLNLPPEVLRIYLEFGTYGLWYYNEFYEQIFFFLDKR